MDLPRAFARNEGLVSAAEQEKPLWMFRCGKVSPMPPEQRTLRRRPSDILVLD